MISSARIAKSRSARAVDCPAMGVPPDIDILVPAPEGFGVELRDVGVDFGFDFATGSDIRYPADGRSFATGFGVLDLEALLLVGALAL